MALAMLNQRTDQGKEYEGINLDDPVMVHSGHSSLACHMFKHGERQALKSSQGYSCCTSHRVHPAYSALCTCMSCICASYSCSFANL